MLRRFHIPPSAFKDEDYYKIECFVFLDQVREMEEERLRKQAKKKRIPV
jgi:hypothetical protein